MEDTPQYINQNIDNHSLLYDSQDYYLVKNKKIIKICVEILNDNIVIKSNKYSINLETLDLSLLLNINFDSITNAYNYIIDIFEENNVTIKNISKKKEMNLIFKLNNKKNIEIILLYDEKENNLIIKEIQKLKTEISNLKNDVNKLKKEINVLKTYHYKNPKNIQFYSNIVKDSYCVDPVYKVFTVFKSIDNFFYLIYYNINFLMICYDINEGRIIKEIKNDICQDITCIKHYLDKNKKRDLVMTLNSINNYLKLYNAKNWQCILNINKVYNSGYLLSSDFLNDKEETYIITGNNNDGDIFIGPIKIFDLKGNKIKEINDSKEDTFFIFSYHDIKKDKNYIIAGSYKSLKSYDYNENKLYHNYFDDDKDKIKTNAIINDNEEIIKLIACNSHNIRVWNFHSGILLNEIKVFNEKMNMDIGGYLCLWNDDYVFVGCSDHEIKLVDLHYGAIKKSLGGHKDYIVTIKKIILPKYGECLISQEYGKVDFSNIRKSVVPIKLWVLTNN